jgi:polyisoprenoid-binding protein YceI
MARLRPGRLIGWIAGGAVAVVVLVVAGAFIYIHFISGPAPAPLSLKSASTPSATSAPSATATQPASNPGTLAGSWHVAAGSIVGYRVDEVLAGQNNVAVGRTGDVAGTMTVAGTKVTRAAFTVQMATIRSDESQRDAQFNGRIMDTAAYPTATLTLTDPISLSPVPAAGVIRTYHATASLTMHGHARPVAFTLSAERTSTGIAVSGSIPILFADWNIPNPSFAGFVTTQNHGELEFLIKLSS